MKILLLLSNAPDPKGEAIEVVAHEVVEKAQRLGHAVFLQVILRDPRGSPAAEQAEQTLREMTLTDLVVYPMLYVEDVVDSSAAGTWPRDSATADGIYGTAYVPGIRVSGRRSNTERGRQASMRS